MKFLQLPVRIRLSFRTRIQKRRITRNLIIYPLYRSYNWDVHQKWILTVLGKMMVNFKYLYFLRIVVAVRLSLTTFSLLIIHSLFRPTTKPALSSSSCLLVFSRYIYPCHFPLLSLGHRSTVLQLLADFKCQYAVVFLPGGRLFWRIWTCKGNATCPRILLSKLDCLLAFSRRWTRGDYR